jgi:4'-phosphopantetheinyl transferase
VTEPDPAHDPATRHDLATTHDPDTRHDPATVHVWSIGAGVPARVLAELARLLDAEERDRADVLRFPDDRRRFVVAHAATRDIVARHLGASPEQIRWSRGPSGKPELACAQLRVNLSHCDDLALLALTARRAIGVDVQALPLGEAAARLAGRYFPAEESRHVAGGGDDGERAERFAQLWARKEACVKAAGVRLVQGLAVPVRGPGDTIVATCAGAPYRVRAGPVPAGFPAAVALAGTAGSPHIPPTRTP